MVLNGLRDGGGMEGDGWVCSDGAISGGDDNTFDDNGPPPCATSCPEEEPSCDTFMRMIAPGEVSRPFKTMYLTPYFNIFFGILLGIFGICGQILRFLIKIT